MKDMRATIVPKSDQLNADDLLISPITIKITNVEIRDSKEQPVSIFFEGDKGKPYKPGKSMCRVMVVVWGADASKYIGQSMTLYRKETVKWGGLEVGGIRISHMTGIEDTMTIVLTESKGSKKPHVVKPLKTESAPQPRQPDASLSGAVGADNKSAASTAEVERHAQPNGVTPERADAAAPTVWDKLKLARENASATVRGRFDVKMVKYPDIRTMPTDTAYAALKWINEAIDKESQQAV